jgi:hypothetical protein
MANEKLPGITARAAAPAAVPRNLRLEIFEGFICLIINKFP